MGRIFGAIMAIMFAVIGIEANVKLNPEWYRFDKLTSVWITVTICLVFILLHFGKKQIFQYVDDQREQIKTDILTEFENGLMDRKIEETITNNFEINKDRYTQNVKHEVNLFIRDSLDAMFDREFQRHSNAVNDKISNLERLYAINLINQSSNEQSNIGVDTLMDMLGLNSRHDSVSEEVR
ncbi:hypothetical protein P4J11_24995 [Bacillus cereus]|nr:hypothetical protein [Bacillus cereus]MEB9557668.1 hypothetical protein [Bacillus cereus]